MLKIIAAIAALIISTSSFAQEAPMTCQESVTSKHLSGAAKSSHLKKCENDAKAACEAKSAEKKLSGAAKTSFEKKCLKDAVGTAPIKN